MNFVKYSSYLLLSLFLITPLFGMEKTYWAQKEAIKTVPQYVYENCNQAVRHNWTREEFLRMKERAETITRDDIRKETPEEEAFIKQCELYDWIHTLNFIETLLSKGPVKGISVETIKKINACLTRLTTASNGKFRTGSVTWPKEVSKTESYFAQYMNKNAADISAGLDPLKIDALGDMSVLLVKLVLGAGALSFPDLKIELNKVQEWQKKCPGITPGTISYENWINTYYHVFPPQDEIDRLVKQWSQWSYGTHDPIQKACYLHYKMVEIHPFDEANKRTGRAISILFDLSHGLLPTPLSGETGEKYHQLLQDGFEKDEGVVDFTFFINNLMSKARLACFICHKTENLNKCGRCKKIEYCCADHQKQDWSRHKPYCVAPTI